MKTRYKIVLFEISVITAGIIFASSVVFVYFPYFGLWDESKIFENLGRTEIVSRTEKLDEVKLFLEKYPDAEIQVDWKRGQVLYAQEQMIKTKYGDEKRKLDMQIKFDMFGNPSPYIIGCSGNNISIGGFGDVLEKLESDWCFDGRTISIEDN